MVNASGEVASAGESLKCQRLIDGYFAKQMELC